MKILLVDDNAISRNMAQKVLATKGDEVVVMTDGQKAWEYFQRHVISIVVTDWSMPEMDSLELCRRIRSSDVGHYTYIVVLTAGGDKESRLSMLQGGADDVVAKPFDPRELSARIATGERIIRLEDQHKSMQTVLSESRDKIRTVLDSLHEEIITIDQNQRLVSANLAFIHARNMEITKVIGKPYRSLLAAAGTDIVDEITGKCFRHGQQDSLVYKTRDLTGKKRIKELSSLPVKNKAGETIQVILISRDITDEMEKNRKINELNKQLNTALNQINRKNQTLESTLHQLKESQLRILQSEKMASIGQLAAGIAHEINNPTGYVSSNLKTLSDYQQALLKLITLYRKLVSAVTARTGVYPVMGDISALLDEIVALEKSEEIDYILNDMLPLITESREGTQRIKKIVNDLKAFSHPGADEIKAVDINEHIESTLNIVWNEIKYKSRVDKAYGELPLIWCRSQRINHVIMNILVNAAQAIEAEGIIRIQTRLMGDQAEITISDNGSGISEENLPRIFDPFFTTKAVGKGTGLGLHLAYNIIKDHNGTIDVRSRIGEGTTFIIRLPVNTESGITD